MEGKRRSVEEAGEGWEKQRMGRVGKRRKGKDG